MPAHVESPSVRTPTLPPSPAAAARSDLERDTYIDLAGATDQLQRHFVTCLKPFELTVAQFNVLRAIALADRPVPVGYIVEAMLTRTPDMTRLLDRLEARDLITRRAGEKDRRSVSIALTAAGRRLHLRAGRAVDDEHERQWSVLTDTQLRQLQDLLRLVRDGLDRSGPTAGGGIRRPAGPKGNP